MMKGINEFIFNQATMRECVQAYLETLFSGDAPIIVQMVKPTEKESFSIIVASPLDKEP